MSPAFLIGLGILNVGFALWAAVNPWIRGFNGVVAIFCFYVAFYCWRTERRISQ